MNNKERIKKLLRYAEEPYIYLDEMTVHILSVENCIKFMALLKDFYSDWSKQSNIVHLPKKQVFEASPYKGDHRVMPCTINYKNKITKAVKVIGTNEENSIIKDKISVGKSLLIHPEDNHIHAIFDACALSSFRTAAISVLAYKSINKQSSSIGIVGLGRIGFYTALILHKWLGVNHFYGFEVNDSQKNNFLELATIYMPEVCIEFDEIGKAEELCESLFVCTDSKKALLNRSNAKNIRFISSVGADANNLSEIDSSLINDRKIVTDFKHSMMLGDLQLWSSNNLIDENDVLELNQYIPKPDQKTLFISTGIAVQDALLSQFLYDIYQDQNS